MKWLWRFPNETNALWYKVIKTKFGLNSNRWDSNIAQRATLRCPWSDFITVRRLLKACLLQGW